MKERITYLLADGEPGINPADLVVKEDSIWSPDFEAAKEWRITLGVNQLPTEIQAVLKDSHELHVRWATSLYHESVSPLLARIPPGLHLSHTPLKERPVPPELCPLIKRIFGNDLKCNHAKEAFTRASVLSERFASSAAYQYYQHLTTIDNLQDYLYYKICQKTGNACTTAASEVGKATALEFDYDAISQSVVVTATWRATRQRAKAQKRSPDDRVEVGILNRETEKDSEKISLGGFLTVLGEDDRPKPTLFSFPSRHHQVPLSSSEFFTFTTSFREPTGLHPTLQLHFSDAALTAPLPSCSLHTYLTLPSTLFIDRYQFSDPLFLASQNLVALRSLSGATDLEAPEWVVPQWGSAALFSLLTPDDLPSSKQPAANSTWTVSLPLHLRYLPPRYRNASSTYPASSAQDSTGSSEEAEEGRGIATTSIPYPLVFWACPAESGLKMSVNPFDRVNLGYDGLFGPKTMFWHVPPQGATQGEKLSGTDRELSVEVYVPVLDLDGAKWVEAGTGLVVALGFAWVLFKLWMGLGKGGVVEQTRQLGKGEKTEVKKEGKKMR